MTEITVRDLLKMVYEQEERVYGERVDDYIEYSLGNVDIFGEGNDHLCNPLNGNGECHYFRPRETPLTGDEIIRGDYILYDVVGHNGDEFINSYETFDELERNILGGAGVFNMFTTVIVAIVHGKVKRYKVDGDKFERID